MLKLIRTAISMVVALTLSAALATSVNAQTLRYGSSQPVVNAVYVDAVTPFIDRVQEASDLRIRAYPGGQLVSARGALASLSDGTADASLLVPLWTPSDLPYINGLLQVLFAGNDPVVVTAAIAETTLLHCPQCREEMARNGAMSLAPYATSPYYLQCNRTIASSAELNGAKVRVVGGAQSVLLDQLGMTRVVVTAPEIAEGLSRGQIDCAIAPLSWLQSYSLGDGVRSIVDAPVGIARGIDAFALRSESWNGLDATEKAALLRNVPQLLMDVAFKGFKAEDQAAIAFAKENGITFVDPDAAFEAAVDDVRQNERKILLQEAAQRGLDNFEPVLDAHLAALEKWRGLSKEVDGDSEALADLLWNEVYSKLPLE